MHPDDPASGAAFTAEDHSNAQGRRKSAHRRQCAPQAASQLLGPKYKGDQAHDYLCAKAPASEPVGFAHGYCTLETGYRGAVQGERTSVAWPGMIRPWPSIGRLGPWR
jgi:hypothetical protein